MMGPQGFSAVFTRLMVAVVLPLAGVRAANTGQAPDVPAELPPQIEVLQPGVKLTLLAENPAIVTPTGIDLDKQGRIWVVSCHTHFRPSGYAGPVHDEVLVFDPDGKNRRVFYNRTDQTMNLKVGRDGWIYLATRNRILRVRDSDGDGTAHVEEDVVVLQTTAEYPHNGLSGMAWLPSGELMFGLGENFGRDWRLTGRGGDAWQGRGEGGVFRCRPDGTELHRIARGFWNPFGLMARSDGESFAVDNDPSSRPPCRILSLVEGADYGFQLAYGSAPVHPFVAWNGELRGTLGMIHPAGEAPCAIVELGGGALVPSWSNHCVDYFPLVRKGAGYRSEQVRLVRGGDYFRPTGMAAGPDGAYYFNDWVFSSYALHGRGRLWKLEIDRSKADWLKTAIEPVNPAAHLASEMRAGRSTLTEPQLFEHARCSDPYLSDAALSALARSSGRWTAEYVRRLPAIDRVWALVALRRVNLHDEQWCRAFLHDSDPEIQFECLRWIADGVLTSFAREVERMLSRPDLDYRLFEAALATWNTLRGKPEAGVTDVGVLLERLGSAGTPARIKSYALRLLPPNHPKLTLALLRSLLAPHDPVLSLEVARTLAARAGDDAREMLAEIAADDRRAAEVRADAIAGLAASIHSRDRALLLTLARNQEPAVRNEALRSLRSHARDPAGEALLSDVARRYPESASLVRAVLEPASISAGRPAFSDTDAWLRRIDSLPDRPDREAGQRIFFHPRLAVCSVCHRHGGRGNIVGPDLSAIAQQGDRKAILQSILEPDREVAPQFYPTRLTLKDGGEFTGILLRSSTVDVFRDLTGRERTFQKSDMVERTELRTSVMPPGLLASLADSEIRDLLAFLTSGSESASGPRRVPLWPGTAPRGDGTTEESLATVQVYRPKPDRATGAAVVICPGGGYVRHVVDREGWPVAEWLVAHGIAAVLLEYRLPGGRSLIPLLDAQRALRLVRANASDWGIDSQRVGILGFSAGGHVASIAGTHFDAGRPGDRDPVERMNCRPDFMLLVYPVITMGDKTHRLSRTQLLGENPSPEMVRFYSSETQVTSQTPPAFLVHARDDLAVPPENSRMFVGAMKAQGVPVQYLELPSGGHGLNGCQGPLWEEWKAAALGWLAAQKFITATP